MTSRHLATLVASGLLEVESAGRERIYRANDELVRDVLQTWRRYFEGGENAR